MIDELGRYARRHLFQRGGFKKVGDDVTVETTLNSAPGQWPGALHGYRRRDWRRPLPLSPIELAQKSGTDVGIRIGADIYAALIHRMR